MSVQGPHCVGDAVAIQDAIGKENFQLYLYQFEGGVPKLIFKGARDLQWEVHVLVDHEHAWTILKIHKLL